MKKDWIATDPTYQIYKAMLARCLYPSQHNYPRYGGRGIKVCDRWRHSFAAFLQDMGERPSPDLTLDRKDSDRDYTPENCRWSTVIQQNRNRRNTPFLECAGQRRSLAEWAERLGMCYHTLYDRLKRGWSIERALTTTLSGETRELPSL